MHHNVHEPPMTTAELQPTDETKRRGPGPPPANRNAWRHGLYSPTRPQPGTYVDKMGNEYRRHIEERALAIYGEIGAYEAGLIQSATEATKTAMEIMDRVKKHSKEMSHDQILSSYAAYLRALDMRDRKAKELGLGLPLLDDSGMWDALDAQNGAIKKPLIGSPTEPETTTPPESKEATP